MKRILLLAFCFVSAHAQTNKEYKAFIEESEGRRNIPYQCSKGIKTVGVGHTGNINKSYYSDKEIDELFQKDFIVAITDARALFPSFDSQPAKVKLILVSLSFNLGKTKLSKFVKFRTAIAQKDYIKAAKELKDSNWYKQVGIRGPKYFNILLAIR